MKELYGEEYPAAIKTREGKLPLWREKRFSRSYRSGDKTHIHEISRFMDGSASITAADIAREWSSWDEKTKIGFCQNCCWLERQNDFPEILRFILGHGDDTAWSGIAISIATVLPQEEAFQSLVAKLSIMDLRCAVNITQAIARTKHRDAERTLRDHLAKLWSHQSLWDDDGFVNWLAYSTTCCIKHLIELGADPVEFTEHVRKLSQHVCSENREACRNFLAKYYSWLDAH